MWQPHRSASGTPEASWAGGAEWRAGVAALSRAIGSQPVPGLLDHQGAGKQLDRGVPDSQRLSRGLAADQHSLPRELADVQRELLILDVALRQWRARRRLPTLR